MLGRANVTRVSVVAMATVFALSGCGSSGSDRTPSAGGRGSTARTAGSGARPSAGGAPGSDTADRAFLAQMITHHERAIAVARIAQTSATDTRVRTFADRVVREQSPELAAMQKAAAGMSLDYSAGAAMAMHRITDPQVTALRALHGAAFDRQWVRLNVTSEQGAYAMARTELGAGRNAAARTVATGISHSPSEIAELQTLLADLG